MKNILTAIGDLIYNYLNTPDRQEQKKLFDSFSISDEIPLPKAYAMLLVDVALIDNKFDKKEYDYIFNYFRTKFHMEEHEIRELISMCNALISNMRSTEAFAEFLSKELDLEERRRLLNTLTGLIKSDGIEDGFELYLKSRFSKLLDLDESKKASEV
ncbi:MAG TPA: TerB family tellurite resistance protein [Oligoflexia bacterium]|nr:TerB family tellurite resistance protein [Oligoflexia bacterium]HMP49678.1 TerB family tellurite resistance protein [Oligoflexia bacterium]